MSIRGVFLRGEGPLPEPRSREQSYRSLRPVGISKEVKPWNYPAQQLLTRGIWSCLSTLGLEKESIDIFLDLKEKKEVSSQELSSLLEGSRSLEEQVPLVKKEKQKELLALVKEAKGFLRRVSEGTLEVEVGERVYLTYCTLQRI